MLGTILVVVSGSVLLVAGAVFVNEIIDFIHDVFENLKNRRYRK